MHLLFVCTGNICRSPLAERIALAFGAELGIPDFAVSSAGTRAAVSHPIHPDAASVLASLGGDAHGFAARQLTPRVALSADLILAMTRAHRDAVLSLAPRKLNCTFTLSEAARLASDFKPATVSDLAALRPRLGPRDAPDIPDPIGQDSEVFASVGASIALLLPPVLELCRASAIQA